MAGKIKLAQLIGNTVLVAIPVTSYVWLAVRVFQSNLRDFDKFAISTSLIVPAVFVAVILTHIEDF